MLPGGCTSLYGQKRVRTSGQSIVRVQDQETLDTNKLLLESIIFPQIATSILHHSNKDTMQESSSFPC